MTPPRFTFERSARTVSTAVVVALVWVVMMAAWFWLDAATWIVAIFALFTLPALIDLTRNPQSGLRLGADTLSWHSGRHSAEIAVQEIEHVRLDTRLDFSVRASVVLRTGRKVRLPFESTPPHQEFEDALTAAGIKTKRFHFHLFQ
jgi:hypothetical protein